ncbi:MAG: hypothetical protein KJ955_03550 [Nanoarchaeota archaeon]|nr:hypothetical protein [Nanoarchaeota archaeon]
MSLDAAVAVVLVFIFIALSVYYVGKANDEPLSRLQMVRAGSDVMLLLDKEDAFSSLNQDEIAKRVSAILPPVYEMRLRINGTFPGNVFTVETARDEPEGSFIASGERLVVIPNSTGAYYGRARYWVWLK